MNNTRSASAPRTMARSLVIGIQRNFGFYPRDICLISGAPRSGTSALVKWLGGQKEILAFPESRILIGIHGFLKEASRFNNLERERERVEGLARQMAYDYYIGSKVSLGKRLIVDKEPLEPIAFPSKGYAEFIADVKRLFPASRLLFAIRDPLATVWSMSRRAWGESLTQPTNQTFSLDEHVENWRSCTELIMQYRADPNAYIVQFGRLTKDPLNESRRIFDFLKIRNGIPFQPRETKETRFDAEEEKRILAAVLPQMEKLRDMGISDLS